MRRCNSLAPLIFLLILQGCALRPSGATEERERALQVGAGYEKPLEHRPLPAITKTSTWSDLLHRAFLANGELEGSYHEWRAAIEKIDKESSWPNTPIRVGFESMFGKAAMKGWDSTTLGTGFMNDTLVLPTKASQSGKVALSEAEAAGQRFFAKKFEIQRRVLDAWLDYSLAEARLEAERENIDLLKLLRSVAEARVRAGAPQQDLIKAHLECDKAQDVLLTARQERKRMQVMLNTLLAREPEAPLPNGGKLAPRAVPNDAELLGRSALFNPEVAELEKVIEGKQNALVRAQMMYLPDISPMASITGTITRMLGAMVMFPSNLAAVRAEVNQMRSLVSASDSVLRQTKLDKKGEFVAELIALRNYERQIELFREKIVPASRQAMKLSEESYATGRTEFVELVDAHHLFTESKLALFEAMAGREKKVASLEAIAGVDMERILREAPREVSS